MSRNHSGQGGEREMLVEPLSEREIEILRLSADNLSKQEIANKLALAYSTVKWYSQQSYRKLGVHGKRQAILRARELGLLGEKQAKAKPVNTLPAQLTTFIGREKELAQVTTQLTSPGPETRLVTLTGPGGSGKTRLALEAAGQTASQFSDGVFFVSLAPLNNPDLIASTIAHSLDLVESPGEQILDRLKDYLQHRKLLLVLDNFEHLLPAASLLTELLSSAPQLKILVTSREILHLYGEQVLPVPPMEVPQAGKLKTASDINQYEAIQLFYERARAVQPDFSITDADLSCITEICIHLDGLPLAIELAAARLRLLTIKALLEQLSNRFVLLNRGPHDAQRRQRTLRETIDWSYNLLEKKEQRLFARLAIFQGGCNLDAARQVCGSEPDLDVMDGLDSLVDKSLVQQRQDSQGEPRFYFLETIQTYAREKLEQAQELPSLHQKHATYFLDMVEQGELHLSGGPLWTLWRDRMEAEHNNISAVLDWTLSSGDVELGAHLLGSLNWFWGRQGYYEEWQHWVERALPHKDKLSRAARAKLLLALGGMLYAHQDWEGEQAALDEAQSIFQEEGDQMHIAVTQVWRCGALVGQVNKLREALSHGEQALAIFRELNLTPGTAQTLNTMAEALRAAGEINRAKSLYEEILALARENGDQLRELIMHPCLGFIAQRQREFDKARGLFIDGLTLGQEINYRPGLIVGIAAMGGLAVDLEEPLRAARLMGAAEAMMGKTGFRMDPADQMVYDKQKSVLQQMLPEEDIQAAWAEGQRMSLENAIAFAMEAN